MEEKAVLAKRPLDLPKDWVERDNRADNDEKELQELRYSVQRGRPYGSSAVAAADCQASRSGVSVSLGRSAKGRTPGP